MTLAKNRCQEHKGRENTTEKPFAISSIPLSSDLPKDKFRENFRKFVEDDRGFDLWVRNAPQ